jgi:signal transduction histidine kinase
LDLVAARERAEERLKTAIESWRLADQAERSDDSAERARSLAEFAAGAGHELNNPLAVIQGRAQLLRARTTDSDAAKSLETIVAQAQRAHRMLRDLMYVSRPPAPRLRPCRPDLILEDAVTALRPESDRRGIRLAARILKLERLVNADPDGLQHIAEVLIRNALEATQSGGFVEVIGSSERDAVRWQVRDSGGGISDAEAEHLLDPFYCGRQAGRGLGLGLSRVSRYLALVDGELDWRTSQGHGTIFRVRVPVGPINSPTVLTRNLART